LSAQPSLSAQPPHGPVPSLRTGSLLPIDEPNPLKARVLARLVRDKQEWLELRIEDESTLARWQGPHLPEYATDVAAGELPALAFAAQLRSHPSPHLWIRRPQSMSGKPLRADGYIRASSSEPGRHFQLQAADAAAARVDPTLPSRFAEALAEHLRTRRGPWYSFATQKLTQRFGDKAKVAGRPPVRGTMPERAHHGDFAQLMETTTGVTSIQEALQMDRGLLFAAGRKPTIGIDTLRPPALARHPWTEMMAKLGGRYTPDPLAASVPAEFYYLRAGSLTVLLKLLDQIDAWGTPASQVLDERAEDHGLGQRYEAQLGLARGPLTRLLGPAVVSELAIVGSDPYVKEGSDLTFLFRIKSKTMFDAAIATTLATYADAHGSLGATLLKHQGVTITAMRSPDGGVRQHRAAVGDLEIVSNSEGAIRRVLDSVARSKPCLSDEPDFQYMLARDPDAKADALAFMSDRFVAEVIGPRQKILEARRQIALGELLTPGYAALLFGWLNGRSPASIEELENSGLLSRDELKHGAGAALRWSPGRGALSSWGTPAAMTPLIDLPRPEQVSEDERDGYQRFASSYERNWRGYVDPTAIRITFDPPTSSGSTLGAEMRVLPLIDQSDYRAFVQLVGTARVQAPPAPSGARAVAALGELAGLRRELGHSARRFMGKNLELDWIGEWAMVGVLDRSVLAEVTLAMDADLPQLPNPQQHREGARVGEIEQFARLPAYAAIGVRSTLGAGLVLTSLRKMAEEAMPGMVRWGEDRRHRGVPIVRVEFNPHLALPGSAKPGKVTVLYALMPDALLISLHEGALLAMIDARLEGRGPNSARGADAQDDRYPQFALDISSDKGAALWTVLSWILEQTALEGTARSRESAEVLLRGAPEQAADPAAMRALALAYFGSAPITPDGASWSLSPQGVRDPVRGTPYAPIFPSVPVPGSPVDKVMAALRRFHAELGFDPEPGPRGAQPMRSLHVRTSLAVSD
jgi:hypothetical protein